MQNHEQAMREAMRLAHSSQGQQLMNKLQNQHSDEISQAMNHAAQGDYTQAQQVLSKLLSDPEMQKLMKQFGGHHE